MSGLRSNTGQEDMLRAYYKLIGEAHIENVLEELSENVEEIQNTPVPDSLDQWVKSYALKQKRAIKKKVFLKKLKVLSSRAAMIAILLISSTMIVTFTVDAVRVRVLNFLLEVNETYTEVQIQVEDDQQPFPDIDQEGIYYPIYLPKGYIYEDHRSFGKSIMLTFSNGIEKITLDQSPNGASYQLDTEDAETLDVNIDGNEGLLILKENRVILFWHDVLISYTIISYDVEPDEIMKMAESMVKQ